jgi:hypothetical protein
MNKRLARFASSFSLLVISSALLSGEVCAQASGQTSQMTSGPICVKCTAGPQGSTPLRNLRIHVVMNNHPVKNAKVTLSDPTGSMPDRVFTTDATGTIRTGAALGMYKVSAQKKAYSGSQDLPVSSGSGGIDISVDLAATPN